MNRALFPNAVSCFNSRTPRGVRRRRRKPLPSEPKVSIHAPRVGCDIVVQSNLRLLSISFNSRTPRGVRRKMEDFLDSLYYVSIHAPRVGCDQLLPILASRRLSFNSRTPRGVRLLFEHGALEFLLGFNSRTPRGVRLYPLDEVLSSYRFNSRTPRGVRLKSTVPLRLTSTVSIHAPRVGCDPTIPQEAFGHKEFQFTHPAWGATYISSKWQNGFVVSIHAPRVGCDRSA